jgi:ABC-2 type transport system ATP-binding protein
VRDLILELRTAGKTVFFSSHILSDVEQLSDRVAIVVGGKLQDLGRPRDLVGHTRLGTEVRVLLPAGDPGAQAAIGARAGDSRRDADELVAALPADADVDDFVTFAHARGAKLVSVTPRFDTIEDLFLRRVEAAGGAREVHP